MRSVFTYLKVVSRCCAGRDVPGRRFDDRAARSFCGRWTGCGSFPNRRRGSRVVERWRMTRQVRFEHRTALGRVIRVVQGDLTLEQVDAIVNAANGDLATEVASLGPSPAKEDHRSRRRARPGCASMGQCAPAQRPLPAQGNCLAVTLSTPWARYGVQAMNRPNWPARCAVLWTWQTNMAYELSLCLVSRPASLVFPSLSVHR